MWPASSCKPGSTGEDAEQDYLAIRNSGSLTARCLAATVVANKYDREGDELKAAEWQKVQSEDCERAQAEDPLLCPLL